MVIFVTFSAIVTTITTTFFLITATKSMNYDHFMIMIDNEMYYYVIGIALEGQFRCRCSVRRIPLGVTSSSIT